MRYFPFVFGPWAIIAFAHLEPNPIHWQEGDRAFAAIFTFLILIIIVGLLVNNDTKGK